MTSLVAAPRDYHADDENDIFSTSGLLQRGNNLQFTVDCSLNSMHQPLSDAPRPGSDAGAPRIERLRGRGLRHDGAAALCMRMQGVALLANRSGRLGALRATAEAPHRRFSVEPLEPALRTGPTARAPIPCTCQSSSAPARPKPASRAPRTPITPRAAAGGACGGGLRCLPPCPPRPPKRCVCLRNGRCQPRRVAATRPRRLPPRTPGPPTDARQAGTDGVRLSGHATRHRGRVLAPVRVTGASTRCKTLRAKLTLKRRIGPGQTAQAISIPSLTPDDRPGRHWQAQSGRHRRRAAAGPGRTRAAASPRAGSLNQRRRGTETQ